MNYIKKALIVFLCTASLVGCKNNNNKTVLRLDAGSILDDQSLNNEQKAEELALIGEQLLLPTTLPQAMKVFEMALSFDEKNKRALLYKYILAPKMLSKGILAKLKKASLKDIKFKTDLAKASQKVKYPEIRSFLLDSSESITTEKEAQQLLSQIYDAYNDLRLFAKNNKDLEITLNINSLYQSEDDDCWESSYYQDSNVYVVESYCPETKPLDFIKFKMERADVEALQHIAAGIQLYLTTALAYDFSGAYDTHLKFANTGTSGSIIMQNLLKNKDFGTLRDPKYLTNIKSMGLDYTSAARWALSVHDQLCAKGYSSKENRKGKVFEKGFCLFEKPTPEELGYGYEDVSEFERQEFIADLDLLEMALKGQPLKETFGPDDEYETVVKYSAIVENPIVDIRSLGAKFDDEGLVSVKDKTLGGMFPNGDVNYILKLNR